MASHMQTSFLIFAFLISSFFIPSQSQGGRIATYWGENSGEGTLSAACATGLYDYVTIGFLTNFGNGRNPVLLNVSGHCSANQNTGNCSGLNNEISACQAQGIKVFLSLGGASGSYSLSSVADAQKVANDLWNNYLDGKSDTRPIGSVVLDGIDFDIQSGDGQFYDELAKALREHTPQLLLSAAPQCPYPDPHLDTAIQTGLFNFIWVKFYNNPSCDFRAGLDALVDSWTNWQAVPSGQIFLGLPASTLAARSGYIAPGVLINRVLPKIRTSQGYGGVMVWNKFYDRGYSRVIKSYALTILRAVSK